MPLDQRAIFCSLFTVPLGERLFYSRVNLRVNLRVATLAQLPMTIFGYGVSKWTTPRVRDCMSTALFALQGRCAHYFCTMQLMMTCVMSGTSHHAAPSTGVLPHGSPSRHRVVNPLQFARYASQPVSPGIRSSCSVQHHRSRTLTVRPHDGPPAWLRPPYVSCIPLSLSHHPTRASCVTPTHITTGSRSGVVLTLTVCRTLTCLLRVRLCPSPPLHKGSKNRTPLPVAHAILRHPARPPAPRPHAAEWSVAQWCAASSSNCPSKA